MTVASLVREVLTFKFSFRSCHSHGLLKQGLNKGKNTVISFVIFQVIYKKITMYILLIVYIIMTCKLFKSLDSVVQHNYLTPVIQTSCKLA